MSGESSHDNGASSADLVRSLIPELSESIVMADTDRLNELQNHVVTQEKQLLLKDLLSLNLRREEIIFFSLALGRTIPQNLNYKDFGVVDLFLDVCGGYSAANLGQLKSLIQIFSEDFLDDKLNILERFHQSAQLSQLDAPGDVGLAPDGVQHAITMLRELENILKGDSLDNFLASQYIDQTAIKKSPDSVVDLLNAIHKGGQTVVGDFSLALLGVGSQELDQFILKHFANNSSEVGIVRKTVAELMAEQSGGKARAVGSGVEVSHTTPPFLGELPNIATIEDDKRAQKLAASTARQREFGESLVHNYALATETRNYDQILAQGVVNGYLTFHEVREIVMQADLTVEDLKLWTYYFLVAREDSNPRYSNIQPSNSFGLYLRDALIHSLMSEVHSGTNYELQVLQSSFKKMLHQRDQIARGRDVIPTGPSRAFQCLYCGTIQVFSVGTGFGGEVVNYVQCPGCVQMRQFLPLVDKNSTRSELTKRLEMTTATELWKRGGTALLKDYLNSCITWDEVCLWANRLLLHLNMDTGMKVSKIPHEMIGGFEKSKFTMIIDVLEFAVRESISVEVLVGSLISKPGNYVEPTILENEQSTVHFCAKCGDVWRQPVAGVGLHRMTDNPVFDPQDFVISPPQCGDCNSFNVYETADFTPEPISPDLAQRIFDNPKAFDNSRNLMDFIEKHFSFLELKNLITALGFKVSFNKVESRLAWKLTANLSGSTVRRKIQEFVGWANRSFSTKDLLVELLRYKFDSGVSGQKVAVKCSSCGTIAVTRMNNEGLVLLNNCYGCNNLNHWTIYTGELANVPPYDLYQRYTAQSGEAQIPTFMHQSQLRGDSK
ncbi:MAG: hypothetical protein WAU07_01190 [Microgenomates group bacterium]